MWILKSPASSMRHNTRKGFLIKLRPTRINIQRLTDLDINLLEVDPETLPLDLEVTHKNSDKNSKIDRKTISIPRNQCYLKASSLPKFKYAKR